MKVELERQQVVVYTVLHRIEGELAVPATARISDRLNQAKDFLPIEHTRIYSLDGQLLYASPVVIVNKSTVVMILEREEMPRARGRATPEHDRHRGVV